MRVRRRNLRKGLLAVGFLVGAPTGPGTALGLGAITLGGALHLWSKGCLEQNRRLITAGPYRHTRNPFYLANAMIDAGLCVVIGNVWVAAIFGLLWVLAYRDTIAEEEARLRSLFPAAHARYVERVPRFFPNGRSMPRAEVTGRFSFDNPGLARGQEYARLLGIALGPGVVWAGALIRSRGDRIVAGEDPETLAFVAALPAIWIVKLGLAEIYRRPDSALVPGRASAPARAAMALSLAMCAGAAWSWLPWVTVCLAMWAGLLALEAGRVARAAGASAADGATWRYLRPVAWASTGAAGLLFLIDRGIA